MEVCWHMWCIYNVLSRSARMNNINKYRFRIQPNTSRYIITQTVITRRFYDGLLSTVCPTVCTSTCKKWGKLVTVDGIGEEREKRKLRNLLSIQLLRHFLFLFFFRLILPTLHTQLWVACVLCVCIEYCEYKTRCLW